MSKQTDLINIPDAITVSGSNVGIGTSSPTNGKLEVTHSSSTIPAGFFRNTSGSGDSSALTVQGGANNAAPNFSVLDYNGNTDFVVQGAGNVGIGESDPDSTLTVKGASHTNFQVKSNSESTKAFIQTVQDSDVRIGSSTNHPVTLYQNGSERMRIDSSGRVGIAQDTPGDFNAAADDLVIGNSGGDFGMTIRTGTASNGSIHFADGTTGDAPNRGIITYDHSDDHMQFNVAASERMRIDSSGRVTKPNHPAFFAVGNAGQTSYSAGAQVLIVNEQWDRNNNFSTSTGRFTAPVTGAYLFTYGFFSYEASKQFTIKVNNGDYAPSDTSGLIDAKDTSDMCNGTMLLYLTANDYVTVGYRSGASGSVYLNHCWFGGHLIG